MKKWLSHIYALFGYTFLSLVLTYPLTWKIFRAIPGNRGDDLQHLWNLWWIKKALLDLKTTPYWTDYIFYPTGTTLAYHTLTLFNGLVSIPLQMVFSQIVVYNLLILASFILAGWGTYLLVNYLTENKIASFLGGLVFAFSPYHSIHVQCGQLNLASVQFIPFFVLYLLKTFKEKSKKNIFLAALFLFLASLSSWYYSVYLILFAFLFLIYNLFSQKFRIRKFIGSFLLILILFSLLISPFICPMLKEYFSGATYMEAPDYTRLSADLTSFFIPYFAHPFFKNYVAGIYRKFSVDPYFLGYTVIFLCLYALLKVEPKKTRFWFISILFFFILSLGPYLHILGKVYKNIPLPHLLIQNIPFLKVARSPNRFSLMLYLSAAILVGYSCTHLFSKLSAPPKAGRRQARWRMRFTALLFSSLILFEFLSIPFWIPENMDAPNFYKEIGQEKADYAILELPFSDNNYINARYMYYQTVHQKKILDAYISRRPPWAREFIKGGKNLLENKELLKEKRIKYILLHKSFSEEKKFKELNNLLKEQFGPLSFDDQEITVYEVYQ
jgi:hypothetical protein